MPRINAAFLRALDVNADPVSGGLVFVYEAGTTTPVTTYSDVRLTSPQTFPVVADAAGNFPDIYIPSGSFKVVVQDADGVTLYEADNVDGEGDGNVGSITPLDFGAVGNGDDDDTDAMREFFAALPGRQGSFDPDAVYAINGKLNIPGGDWTLNANGATLDYSGIANANGDVAGSLLGMSGTTGTPLDILGISTSTTAFGLVTVTITTESAHGLIPGDDVLVSSDDVIDTGHDAANERRGQFMRVEEVTEFSFTANQPLYEALPTNPVMTPITWLENCHINGTLRMKGPGRRPTAAGFIGLSMTYVRDCSIDGFETDDVDQQAIVRDNCLRVHAGNLSFRFSPQGGSTAVQYGDTLKNASADCSTGSIICYGGKHAFDWTRNTNPGIGGRGCTIGPIVAYDTWDAAVATHGNSRDLTFTTVKANNCLYAFGVRSPGTRVQDIYGENCYEVLKITDDTRNLSVGSVRGKNVAFVVRAKDTPTSSNEGWIGSLESRNINIGRIEADVVAQNTLYLDWSDIPVFTEADAAVTGGTSTTITVGMFPAPAGFATNQYNSSNALTGSEIAMDWDGAGGGAVQTRTITGHTFSGGVNTFTVSGWATNPVAGTSTYKIRSFVDDVNIGPVISKNCAGADIYVDGPLRRLTIGDMDVISDGVNAAAAVFVTGTADSYPERVRFGRLRNHNKGLAAVSGFAVDVTFEVDAAADTVLKTGSTMTGLLILSGEPTDDLGATTKAYVDERTESFGTRAQAVAWVAANPTTDVKIIQVSNMSFRNSSGATAIVDMPDWLPNFRTTPDHFKTNGVGVDMSDAVQAAADFEGDNGTIEFRSAEYIFDAGGVGTSEGTAVVLTAAHSNLTFKGESGTVLKPASNRIEMFAQNGASNITLDGLVFDNSANGPLQYQVAATPTGPNQGIAGTGNAANCAFRQYLGAGLKVKGCKFFAFNTCISYFGDVTNQAVLSGDLVVDDVTFSNYAFGILARQPENILMSNVIDIDCYQSLNGNNTDGTETDLTVTSNDPGHSIYVANRPGAYPKTVTIDSVASINSDSSSVRVRKGEVVSITNTTHYDCSRFVNVENASQLTLSNVSGDMRASAFGGQTGVDIIDCKTWVASNVAINISGVDAWAFVAESGLGVRNESGTLSNLRVENDLSGGTGKAPILISEQTNVRIESPAYTHKGAIIGSRSFVDVRDSENVQVITPSKHTPDGVDDTRLAEFNAGCVDCVVKWSEADLDQVPNANTIIDLGTGTRVFRDGILSGTYTPVVSFATNGDFSPTYTVQAGEWRKSGGQVTVAVAVEITANAYTTASGNFELTLPFAVKSTATLPQYNGPLGLMRNIDIGSASRMVTANVVAGQAFATLRQNADNTAGATIGTASILPSTAGVYVAFEITYPYAE